MQFTLRVLARPRSRDRFCRAMATRNDAAITFEKLLSASSALTGRIHLTALLAKVGRRFESCSAHHFPHKTTYKPGSTPLTEHYLQVGKA
jgi:hypothetical protein